MILYYALGGGLGHISRSCALIARAPDSLRSRIRLLVSSAGAEVARPFCPCPLDRVPAQAMADRTLYRRFLARYLARYPFTCVVLDTFPFGLVGEWRHLAPELPRVLVGRYLRWQACRERCGDPAGAVWPKVALMIEQQETVYLEELSRFSRTVTARWPVSPARPTDGPAGGVAPACCIVHSGPPEEVVRLADLARRVMAERGIAGAPEIFTPEAGLFPVERHLSRFSDVVAGAGYAACAAAAVLNGRVRYHLHPFPRRFDDQVLRLGRLREGLWGDTSGGDGSTVASLLWGEVVSCQVRRDV